MDYIILKMKCFSVFKTMIHLFLFHLLIKMAIKLSDKFINKNLQVIYLQVFILILLCAQ